MTTETTPTTAQKLTTVCEKLDESIAAVAAVIDETPKSDHLDQTLARLQMLRSKVGKMLLAQVKREEADVKERERLQAELAKIQAKLGIQAAA